MDSKTYSTPPFPYDDNATAKLLAEYERLAGEPLMQAVDFDTLKKLVKELRAQTKAGE